MCDRLLRCNRNLDVSKQIMCVVRVKFIARWQYISIRGKRWLVEFAWLSTMDGDHSAAEILHH